MFIAAAPGVFHRVASTMFWSGFVTMCIYLVYVYVINPEGTTEWTFANMEWYWIIASPFIAGCVFLFLLGFIPVFHFSYRK